MVLPVLNVFKTNPKIARRPILNSIPNLSTTVNPTRLGGFNSMYTRFWRWYRQTPELVATINVITTDVMGDRPEFVKPDGRPLGRNKMLSAKRFWKTQRAKETLKAILSDMLVTGDGYGWIGHLSKETQENKLKEITKSICRQIKEMNNSEYRLLVKTIDEDLKRPKDFDYVASSTMQIISDSYDVKGYVQRANGQESHFGVKEIIHYRLHTFDGKLEGFSPVESLTRELGLMWFVKGNMVAYQENGGSIGKLFTVKDSQPGQPAFDRFEEQLRACKNVEGRHQSLLASGEIDVNDLDSDGKDMEYQNLALFITSSIAFAFGIPVQRIPYLIGKSATSGDSGGLADLGYWNMISEIQDKMEDLTNIWLFEKLGWNIKLPRKYKQDVIREAQAFQMNVSSVEQMQSILRNQKEKMTPQKVHDLLNIREDDIEEMTDDEMVTDQDRTAMLNQNLLDNQSVNKEPDNRKKADTKRNVANNSANKGMAV